MLRFKDLRMSSAPVPSRKAFIEATLSPFLYRDLLAIVLSYTAIKNVSKSAHHFISAPTRLGDRIRI